MSEISTTSTPEIKKNPSVKELFNQLLELEPKPIASFVLTNASEQKTLFLSGEIRNPNHVYGKLDVIDFADNSKKITKIGDELISHPEVPSKYAEAYSQFVQNYLNKTRFMELAYDFKHADSPEEVSAIKIEFMQRNIESFGEPDELTYRSLLGEKIAKIKGKDLSERGSSIREDLLALVGDTELESDERFRPSQETIEWIKDVAESLYGNLLEHVPDQESFSDQDIKVIFEEILITEFGEVLKDEENGITEGWEVAIEDAQSINVKAAEKKLVIPVGREVDFKTMRGLVVHEIGVHFLRSVMGEQTDLLPFKLGLSEYYDTEEGLGAVMEQALVGEYREAGADHYITAGLAYFGKKDFRDTFEVKWRLALLSSMKGNPTPEDIEKAQVAAYGATMRIERGTDELPWFKDLSYYNGSAEVWKHLESIQGDDIEFTLSLLGKGNSASPAHRRIMLETATV